MSRQTISKTVDVIVNVRFRDMAAITLVSALRSNFGRSLESALSRKRTLKDSGHL